MLCNTSAKFSSILTPQNQTLRIEASDVVINNGSSQGSVIYYDDAKQVYKKSNGSDAFDKAYFAQIVVDILDSIENPEKLAVFLTSPNEDERKMAEIILAFRKRSEQK